MGEKGFTLVEVLVSISLLGLLGVLLFSGLSTSLSYNAEVSERSKLINRLELTNTQLSQDLIQSINRRARDNKGDYIDYSFKGNNQSALDDSPFLSFSINTLTVDKTKGAVIWIEYFLIDGNIQRKEYFYADRTEDTPVYSQILLSQVEEVEVRFYKDTIWTDRWPDVTDLDKNRLPKIIEVIFRVQSIGAIKKLFILSNTTL